MIQHRSSKLTTRSEVNSRLQTLSIRNEELETKLHEAEETCQHYEAKNKAQHALIQNLMETINSLTASLPDDKEIRTSDEDSPKIPEKICLMLTKKAQRISDLVEEVERMKFRLKKEMKVPISFETNYEHDSDESEHDEEDVAFVDISLSDTENDYAPITSFSSSFSSSETPMSGQETIRLEEEIVRISSKCRSLERSLDALKRKSAEREVRSMKSLRNMRQQVESLEQERRRRLDLQSNAEERALQLEIELLELRQENNRQQIFRRQQQSPQEQIESLVNGNIGGAKPKESDSSMKEGIDRCRNINMQRNQLGKDSCPPLLLSVSEESESSEESQGSDDDFRPSINVS